MTDRMPALSPAFFRTREAWYAQMAQYHGEAALAAFQEGVRYSRFMPAFDEAAIQHARLAWSYALDSVNWR